MANKNLTMAKRAKNDEFFTQMSDIEKELKNYRNHFKDAVVFCNCDDPEWSNFWRYFHLNFEYLGLKKLISTHYDPVEPTYKMEYEGGNDSDTSIGKITQLKQNGDFRSPECIELMKSSDIVVTNPPFSLFREYIGQLIEHDKKFVVVGNQNAITYKEIFPLIMNNNVWLGVNSGDMAFKVPADSEPRETRFWIDENGQKWRSMGNACWYTNLDIAKRHEPIDLIEKYHPEKYQNYDNYQIINVDKTLNIPVDYDGVMGVPITMLQYYCPEQFEILGVANSARYIGSVPCLTFIDGKKIYNRILIRRKRGN